MLPVVARPSIALVELCNQAVGSAPVANRRAGATVMPLTLYCSGLRVKQDDVHALAEFLRHSEGGETQIRRLFEANPAIIG